MNTRVSVLFAFASMTFSDVMALAPKPKAVAPCQCLSLKTANLGSESFILYNTAKDALQAAQSSKDSSLYAKAADAFLPVDEILTKIIAEIESTHPISAQDKICSETIPTSDTCDQSVIDKLITEIESAAARGNALFSQVFMAACGPACDEKIRDFASVFVQNQCRIRSLRRILSACA